MYHLNDNYSWSESKISSKFFKHFGKNEYEDFLS